MLRFARVSPLPTVAIVGAPNVGKSTLFNRLVRQRSALVTDEPGVTRDRIYGVVRGDGRSFRIIDTGGLHWGDAPFGREILMQAEAALAESSLVLFVVNARTGPTALDMEVAAFLRRRSASVLLVGNKVDGPAQDDSVHELHALGLGEPLGVSAEHARGIDELIDAIEARLPPSAEEAEETGDVPIKVAIIGRPNVGKSSLLNRLVGEERMMVSDIPGTTRDAVDTSLTLGLRRYLLVDTAGLRRKGRVHETAESLSAMRARQAIERADVVVLVLDGSEPIASARRAHRGIRGRGGAADRGRDQQVGPGGGSRGAGQGLGARDARAATVRQGSPVHPGVGEERSARRQDLGSGGRGVRGRREASSDTGVECVAAGGSRQGAGRIPPRAEA